MIIIRKSACKRMQKEENLVLCVLSEEKRSKTTGTTHEPG